LSLPQACSIVCSDFVNVAVQELGMVVRRVDECVTKKSYRKTLDSDNLIVAVEPCYFCFTEVETLLGYPSKAKLGSTPKITHKE